MPVGHGSDAQCTRRRDCTDPVLDVCDKANSVCVDCLANANCDPATPVCDKNNDKTCVECLANSNCADPTPLCDKDNTRTCAECKADQREYTQ